MPLLLRVRMYRATEHVEGYRNILSSLKVPKNTLASIILKWRMLRTIKTRLRAGSLTKLSNLEGKESWWETLPRTQ